MSPSRTGAPEGKALVSPIRLPEDRGRVSFLYDLMQWGWIDNNDILRQSPQLVPASARHCAQYILDVSSLTLGSNLMRQLPFNILNK